MNGEFHIADYVVLSVIILTSLGIGVFYSLRGKSQATAGDYLLGSRNMSLVPVGLSIMVSYVSAITLLGLSADVYYFGIHIALSCIGQVLGAIVSATCFVPLLYPLKITSTNEYLMLRYRSRVVTVMASLSQIITLNIVCGVILTGTAYLFETVVGCPVWATLLIITISSSIYTCIGGFKAVIWTDVFQTMIMLAGLIAVTTKGMIVSGGPAKVFEVFEKWGRMDLEWIPSPWHRIDMLSASIIFSFYWISVYGVSQGSVQRYSSLPSHAKAVMSLVIVIPSVATMTLLSGACGVVAFAYYTNAGCDPLRGGLIHNKNQLIPALVMDILYYPGVPGLFVSAVLCGSLSTMSTALSSLSALTLQDFIKPAYKDMENRSELLVSKFLVVVYGAVMLACGFTFLNLGGTLVQMTIAITSSFMAPVTVLFFIGAACPRINYKSASVAAMVSFLLILWMSVGANLYGTHTEPMATETVNCSLPTTVHGLTATPPEVRFDMHTEGVTESPITHMQGGGILDKVYTVSYMWYVFLGVVIGAIVAPLTSLIPGFSEERPVDEKYIFPFLRCLVKKSEYSWYDMKQSEEESKCPKTDPDVETITYNTSSPETDPDVELITYKSTDTKYKHDKDAMT